MAWSRAAEWFFRGCRLGWATKVIESTIVAIPGLFAMPTLWSLGSLSDLGKKAVSGSDPFLAAHAANCGQFIGIRAALLIQNIVPKVNPANQPVDQ